MNLHVLEFCHDNMQLFLGITRVQGSSTSGGVAFPEFRGPSPWRILAFLLRNLVGGRGRSSLLKGLSRGLGTWKVVVLLHKQDYLLLEIVTAGYDGCVDVVA